MTSTTYTGNRFKILKQWDSNSLNDHVQLGAFLALQKFSVTCKFLKTCSSLHISNEPSVGDNCTSLTVKFTWDYYLRMLSHIVIIMWEKTKIMSLLPVPCRLKGLRSWAKPELKISLLRVSSVLLSSVFSFPHHFFSPSVFFINPFRSVLATFFFKKTFLLSFSLCLPLSLFFYHFSHRISQKDLYGVIIRQNKDKFVQIFPSWLRWTKCIFISDH